MGLAALLALRARRRGPAMLTAIAALVYLVGGLLLTMAVNVPMNEDLAAAVPGSVEEARRIWEDYCGLWQFHNQFRAIASGASLVLAATALARLRR